MVNTATFMQRLVHHLRAHATVATPLGEFFLTRTRPAFGDLSSRHYRLQYAPSDAFMSTVLRTQHLAAREWRDELEFSLARRIPKATITLPAPDCYDRIVDELRRLQTSRIDPMGTFRVSTFVDESGALNDSPFITFRESMQTRTRLQNPIKSAIQTLHHSHVEETPLEPEVPAR